VSNLFFFKQKKKYKNGKWIEYVKNLKSHEKNIKNMSKKKEYIYIYI